MTSTQEEVDMELSFVVTAVRRYWWVVVLASLVGLVAGRQFDDDGPTLHESTALVLVAEPTSTWSDAAVADRYLLGQLSVFRSSSLASTVADTVGGGLDAGAVMASTEMSQVADTDVISVTAASTDPDEATAIVDAYLGAYFASLQQRIDESQAPGREQLESMLADVQTRLDEANATVAALLEPYLAGVDDAIPTLDQLDPALASRRQLLLQEYDRVALALDDLELRSQVRSASQVIQSASEAQVQPSDSGWAIGIAGLVTGALIGVVAACVLAASTRKVLDEHQVAEMLGVDVVGVLPRVRHFANHPRASLELPPRRATRLVEQVAVQAESRAHLGESLTIAVVGAERGSGTTTLAAIVANRFAVGGSQVLLVDADPHDPELTAIFGADPRGVPTLVDTALRPVSSRRTGPLDRRDPSTATALPGVRVLGAGASEANVLRRQQVPDLLEAASSLAPVVVVDAGPLLESATAAHLAQLADAVVLAVPTRRVARRMLSSVASQLEDRRGELLVVVVPARRRRRGRSDGAAGAPEAATAHGLELLAPPMGHGGRRAEVPAAGSA